MCKDDVSKREPAPATMREAIVAMMREHQIARDKSLPGDIAIGWDKCFDCIKRDITAALALPDIKYIRDDQCTYCGEAHLCSLVPVCEACERASEPWLRPPRPGIDPAALAKVRDDMAQRIPPAYNPEHVPPVDRKEIIQWRNTLTALIDGAGAGEPEPKQPTLKQRIGREVTGEDCGPDCADPAPTVEERADWRTATCAECGYICAYPVECTDDVAHQCRNMFSTHIEPNNAACPAFVRRAQATGEGVQDGQ